MTDQPTTEARVAELRTWAYDPTIPDDEWACVTRPVFRAIEREAVTDAMTALAAEVEAMPQPTLGLAGGVNRAAVLGLIAKHTPQEPTG